MCCCLKSFLSWVFLIKLQMKSYITVKICHRRLFLPILFLDMFMIFFITFFFGVMFLNGFSPTFLHLHSLYECPAIPAISFGMEYLYTFKMNVMHGMLQHMLRVESMRGEQGRVGSKGLCCGSNLIFKESLC